MNSWRACTCTYSILIRTFLLFPYMFLLFTTLPVNLARREWATTSFFSLPSLLLLLHFVLVSFEQSLKEDYLPKYICFWPLRSGSKIGLLTCKLLQLRLRYQSLNLLSFLISPHLIGSYKMIKTLWKKDDTWLTRAMNLFLKLFFNVSLLFSLPFFQKFVFSSTLAKVRELFNHEMESSNNENISDPTLRVWPNTIWTCPCFI